MNATVRSCVTIVQGKARGTWLVQVEDSHADPIFRTGRDTAYHLRAYQLPTVYRSSRAAERAALALWHSMGAAWSYF